MQDLKTNLVPYLAVWYKKYKQIKSILRHNWIHISSLGSLLVSTLNPWPLTQVQVFSILMSEGVKHNLPLTWKNCLLSYSLAKHINPEVSSRNPTELGRPNLFKQTVCWIDQCIWCWHAVNQPEHWGAQTWYICYSVLPFDLKQQCIPEECVPPAHWP